MKASEVNAAQWREFWTYWDKVFQRAPEARRSALYEAGKAAQELVRGQVTQQGVRDPRGRVRSWQSIRMGSGGGYVAVSPDDGVTAQEVVQVSPTGFTTAKDVTRYLEQGHGIRGPSGRAKRYVPRVSSGRTYVPGKQFYSYARMNAGQVVRHAAERAIVEYENLLDDLLGDDWRER